MGEPSGSSRVTLSKAIVRTVSQILDPPATEMPATNYMPPQLSHEENIAAIKYAHEALICGKNSFERFCKSYSKALNSFAGTVPKICVCMTPCTFECFIKAWIDDIADSEFELLTIRLGRVCTQRFEGGYRRYVRKMEWAPLGFSDYMAIPHFACEAYFGFMNHLYTLEDTTLGILCGEHIKQQASRHSCKGKRAIRKQDGGIGANVPIRERVRTNRDGEIVYSGTTFGQWGIILLY